MEEMIKSYEYFIAQAVKRHKTPAERTSLFRLHLASVQNFQHERLVHLLVMFLFILITTALLFSTIYILFSGTLALGIMLYLLLLLDLIMSILSIAYVKHYYFLENHVQALYKYFTLLSDEIENESKNQKRDQNQERNHNQN